MTMDRADADVLIAGGGPAGMSAAIRTAQLGGRPLVLEPKSAPIDKACGEGLMPAALETLRDLGVPSLDGRPFRGIRYVDARQPECRAVGDFTHSGKGVRRRKLHDALAERAAHLGVAVESTRVSSIRQSDRWVEAGGYRAPYLIAADGLHSEIRRELDLGTPARHPPRYGIRRHFRREPWSDRVDVHWSRRGEAYVTPVGEQTVGVAILFEQSGRYDCMLEAFPQLVERLDGAPAVTEERGAGPFEQRVRRRVHGRILLAGDAAGYLDALTGEGVALALETGRAAAEAVSRDAPGDYERRYREATRAYFGLTETLLTVTRSRRMHRPLVRLLEMVPGLFDGVVRLLGGRANN